MDTKTCIKCGEVKPLSAYYKHSGMADGRLNKCKECQKAYVRAYRHTNEKVREYDRARGYRQSLEYCQKWRGENWQKYRCHTALNNAVRDGKVIKPAQCPRCGGTRQIEGHHHDYSRPLDVDWLCSRCHSLEHSPYERRAS